MDMNLPIDENTTITESYGANSDSVASAQSYKVKLSQIIQYADLGNHKGLHNEFRLPCSKNSFTQNAKAFSFEYMGVNCAYVMAKVLGQGQHEMWAAIEIHQYKDSWGLDAGEISWLYLRSEVVNDELRVKHLNLLPINLFVDYETVEVENAFNAIGAPFESDVDFLATHSRMLLQNFASVNSMYWIKELSTLGYVLSQYSQSKLQHPQTKIDIKNALTPYLLNVDGVYYKAASYLVQQQAVGVHNSLWITYLMNQNNEIMLDKMILSFGQYASDLTICKAPSRNVVESSYFLTSDRLASGEIEQWLELIGLEASEIKGCLEVLNKTLNELFFKEFIDRLMLRVEYPDVSQATNVADLTLENVDEFKSSPLDESIFKNNQAMYFSTSSFTQLFYQPNIKYSLIEDGFQQPKFPAMSVESGVVENSEYDFKQPDFNEENKLEKLFSKPQNTFIPKQFNHHGKRSQTHHSTKNIFVDDKIAESEIKRTSKYDKTPPLIRQKHRFKGVVHQAKQAEINEHINAVQADLKESGQIDRFLTSISNLPKNPEHILQMDLSGLMNESTHSATNINKEKSASEVQIVADSVPKKRGRPPKKAVEVIEPTVEDVMAVEVNQETPVAAAPKTRGRPPKKRVETVVEVTQATAIEPIQEAPVDSVPKKRGRPPKKAVEVIKPTAEDVMAVEVNQETPVAAPKTRGRPPKKRVEVDVSADIDEVGHTSNQVVGSESSGEVWAFGGYELSVTNQIVFVDKKVGAMATYPVELIKDNPNYLLNSLIGYGLDKFKAVEALVKCGCVFATYSFHELHKKLMSENEINLSKYLGFENYIIECEFEVESRK